ncbi:MAG: OB-fold domain-containing protein [Chloroflexota bacterium]|nr:OB-fold domain-containing protein [Chloroflexota bacterium]MDE2942546.1 OB-fold domain-containing protein [Chloroflexota bacterium]MDE3268115.1 OB-fold domain-containing protein [Chloroflexota bacterium]
MPKQSPVPDEVDKPFWDAANEDRLVVQNCIDCDRLQHPPVAKCPDCDPGTNLEWKEMSGRGRVYGYGVMYDCPVTILAEDQPFNIAVVELEEDPGIKMLSHLPGTPVDDVPVGAAVEVVFEVTPTTGQKVPEWRVVG